MILNNKKKIKDAIDPVGTKKGNEPKFKETPADAVRVESQSSVEITQGDKGTRFNIKIYHNNPFEASKIATSIYDELKNKFK